MSSLARGFLSDQQNLKKSETEVEEIVRKKPGIFARRGKARIDAILRPITPAILRLLGLREDVLYRLDDPWTLVSRLLAVTRHSDAGGP